MTRVLSVSSHVAYGPVGNSAAVPAMESLGLTVHALPTVFLSNHPGLGRPAGIRVPALDLAAMAEALETLGVLYGLSGVMTGYFAADEQVRCIAQTVRKLKVANPSLSYLCDPVLGDDETGLYVPELVAVATRDELVPLADAITPNRFELAWLSGRAVAGRDDAEAAARTLEVPSVIATSVPGRPEHLLTMLIDRDGATEIETRLRAGVPHGTGDLLSGLYLGHRLLGNDGPAALRATVAAVERVIGASEGGAVLVLAGLRT